MSNEATSSSKKGAFSRNLIINLNKVPYQKKYVIRKPCQGSKKGALSRNLIKNLNGSVFVYELSGCGFESSCSYLMKLVLEFIKNILKQSFKGVMQRFRKLTKKHLN